MTYYRILNITDVGNFRLFIASILIIY